MTIVLRAAPLLIDSSSELIDDGLVIISHGRITKAGSFRSLNGLVAISQEIRDLGDVTLMPGLFDCHVSGKLRFKHELIVQITYQCQVHITLDPSKVNTTTASSSLTDEETTVLMISNCSKLLDAGITNARDLGSKGLLGVKIRDLINAGSLFGPRLQVAHAPITVPGGHAHAMGGVAEGIEGVRAEVRKRANEGADLIKVMSTGGFMTAGSHPSQAGYTVKELEAIKDEAVKFGMKVTTHATGTQGIERAVDARLDSIKHCAWINGELF
jgi:imidazolonepropionase-like amidohydrolase